MKLYLSNDQGPTNLRSCNAPRLLAVKENASLDYKNLSNGLSGTVIKFNENIIEVQIDHDEHLQHAMRGQKFQIEKYKFLIRDEHNNIAAVRDQFPLKLGYSVTVLRQSSRQNFRCSCCRCI